jgi:hypothetical protein
MVTSTQNKRTSKATNRETGLVRFQTVPLSKIKPSPENDRLYRRVHENDEAVQQLAASIREMGVMEPVLLTADNLIVSGHRRCCAARVAGLDSVPARKLPRHRDDFSEDEYVALLREHNRQRSKTFAEMTREAVVDCDPTQAYEALLNQRTQRCVDDLTRIDMSGRVNRSEISPAKDPMVAAIKQVLRDYRAFLPISVRTVHYQLAQNHRPLRHASKPDSVYVNTLACYKSCSELLTRMRIEGIIPHEWIEDETRPYIRWQCYSQTGDFVREQVDEFLKDFRRDLMSSQPRHVHLAVEKNTVFGIAKNIAGVYSIPVSSLRGQTSTASKFAIADSYRKSGKDGLTLLVLSDFDPTGEAIATSVAKCLRDDFDIEDIEAFKIGITADQVEGLKLLSNADGLDVKLSDSSARAFLEKYGGDVTCYELEALSISDLQQIIRDAFDSVLDIDLLNQEREQEAVDAAKLQTLREQLHEFIGAIDDDFDLASSGAGEDE